MRRQLLAMGIGEEDIARGLVLLRLDVETHDGHTHGADTLRRVRGTQNELGFAVFGLCLPKPVAQHTQGHQHPHAHAHVRP